MAYSYKLGNARILIALTRQIYIVEGILSGCLSSMGSPLGCKKITLQMWRSLTRKRQPMRIIVTLFSSSISIHRNPFHGGRSGNQFRLLELRASIFIYRHNYLSQIAFLLTWSIIIR